MGTFRVYAADAVTINFGGLDLPEGRAEEFCKVALPQRYDSEGDASGGLTRFETGDNLGVVELTFVGGSKHLQALSAVHALDSASVNGAGVVPLLIKDNNGATLIASPHAYIVKMGEPSFGVKRGDVTVLIHAHLPAPQAIVGGNG